MGQRWSYSRCVYILESGGLYNIGRTHHLDQWLEQLRSASAHPISVFHVFQTVQDTLLERAIHALCAGDRVHGEWFRLSMRDLV
ncbi:MAG TPA: hypothetical protein DC063_06875, partial [Arenimonas sp.]|nr:hypothetical protein [Arenimonas sp.]